ncbi:MAG TPA: hypothetical protein VFM30_07895 [Steroidobacteraceae bacterium]|jgi:hypothetical protein|nr:hypothetical protein [Steroidobacteraceae bacterium]
MTRSRPHIALVALLTSLTALAASAQQAPPADVTFTVPLDLTRLHADVTRVRVTCTITSAVFGPRTGTAGPRGSAEAAVVQNAVVQTLQVTVPLAQSDFSANASGKTANYSCVLEGNRANQSAWLPFGARTAYDDAAVLTPPPSPLTGTFVW